MNIGKLSACVAALACALALGAFAFQESRAVRAQSRQPKGARADEIPFTHDRKDFEKVEVKNTEKITSRDQAVKDKFPIDAPAHACFYLKDRRPLPALEKGGRYFPPARSFVCFIPTEDATEGDFAAAYPNFGGAVTRLRALLEKRPAEFEQYDDLFDVPYNNAGWSFESKVQYLDYETVSGVFFLTQYSQELTPNLANNEELTANFQGLTRDGKFYVAARFAVAHPALPKGIDFTDVKIQEEAVVPGSPDETTQKVSKYLQAEREKVENLAEETFQPSLASLKKLLASIKTK